MLRIAHVTAGIVIALFATSTYAQQEPLSGLIGAFKKNTQPASGPAAPVAGQSLYTEILATYAVGDTVSSSAAQACRSLSQDIGRKKREADFKLKNYGAASAAYLLAAQGVSNCAVGESTATDFSRIPIAQAVDLVGTNLAMSVIAANAGGLATPQTTENARNALTLLTVNKAAHDDLIQRVKQTGLVEDSGAVIHAPSGFVKMTAKEAIGAYKANSFGFNTKHDGKVLTISGLIQQIYGDASGVTVKIVAKKPANIDTQGFQEVIRCNVVDKAALSKVAELKVWGTTTVTGTFKPDSQVMPVGIELQSCRVE